jgi:integrase
MAALWHLTASTGMRRGAVLGLRWSDVDLDAATLTIRQTLVVVDSKSILSESKTGAGRRTLALDPTTITALRSHRARQA